MCSIFNESRFIGWNLQGKVHNSECAFGKLQISREKTVPKIEVPFRDKFLCWEHVLTELCHRHANM